MPRAVIIDDFLSEEKINSLRAEAISLPYYKYRLLGSAYNGMHLRSNDELKYEIERALNRSIDQQFTFFRRNFKGEFSKDAVHQDTEVSNLVAILYLNRPEDCSGGTALFRHRETGAEMFPYAQDLKREGKSPKREQAKFVKDWHNKDAWEQVERLEMKFNRLVAYSCARFHSRFPREAFGTTPDDARTVWLSFFN